MRHRELEEKLRKKLRLRRVILGISAIVLFIIGAVCSLLRESTREVIVHNYGFLIRDEIVYNNVYVPFIAIGFLGMLEWCHISFSDGRESIDL